MPALRRDDIPPDRLRDLSHGRVESTTMVEWLALDQATLLAGVLADAGLAPAGAAWAAGLAALPVTERVRRIGRHLHERRAPGLRERLQRHRSDAVRIWAAVMIAEDDSLALPARLAALRPFAADPHFGVREYAWMCFRPFLAAELDAGLALLRPWASDPDANVRRFASEVSRPRGVWCAHISALKADPARALAILEPLRADPHRYVQTSVGNWLNDAAKDRPDWVTAVCGRWTAESPGPHTAWIVRHGTRGLPDRPAAPRRAPRRAARG